MAANGQLTSSGGFLVWLGAIWAEMVNRNPKATTQALVAAAESTWFKLPDTQVLQYKDLEKQPVLQVQSEAHRKSHLEARAAFTQHGTIGGVANGKEPQIVVQQRPPS
eukprot:TRINITY_DN11855_c0_g2_i1.p1 TRINITY_DN11855_c0_g2~~TRINITY_DN11855_c0_g2_i1.p1  ORF type:complete len:108 (+),score=21.27 TRINITY_DN11855_c0_g2_i1:359-682(+)